jgi:predicted transport protein/RecB family endonuclease NucS
MSIYITSGKKVTALKELPFKLEKEIQTLVEFNLGVLFGLQLVKSEFVMSDVRIDSLAYDKETKSFVIIEYKKDRAFSVFDQGMSYLSLMLNYRADVVLEYNERCGGVLKRTDVDWTQSRVIFVSPFFTSYQLDAVNFRDLPIEIWEIHRFENDILEIEQHKPYSTTASIRTVSKKSAEVEAVSKEVKTFTEEDHLSNADLEVVELYTHFKELVLSIGPDVQLKPMKFYLAFRSNTNFTDVVIQKRSLKLSLNIPIGKLDDPKKIARDVSNVGHWGNGDYEIQMKDDNDLEYVVSLVRQSYKYNS